MSEQRKRLLYRATHRGTHEADHLVGGFAQRHMAALCSEDLSLFEALLEESDVDLVDWITGRKSPPARVDAPLLRRIIAASDGD